MLSAEGARAAGRGRHPRRPEPPESRARGSRWPRQAAAELPWCLSTRSSVGSASRRGWGGRFPDSLSPMPARSGSPSSARLAQQAPLSPARCTHIGGREAGRRGVQEPKPTPGKNLELGGDQSFSQAPTKDAACRSGGQRGPWGAAGGSTLGAGLTDSAMPNRVPVPGDDWATRLGQTGQKTKHLHFVWFCPI